jgi:serpin B
VNEKGTEAAAATEVEVFEVSKMIGEPPPPKVMKIDRPFIYLIRDLDTGAILFVGRVMNPVQK